MFKHEFVCLPRISSEDTDNGRFYTTPDGNRYLSVTSFLGRISDNSWLEEWKARVGEERANQISTQAKNRGTAVHSILEHIVLNEPQKLKSHMPFNLEMAMKMAKVLAKRCNPIKGIEIGLWSDEMRLAGRADLFADFDGITSIVDFKTAKKPKKESDILNYYLQTTIYAMMVEEILGISVPQLVIIIGVDHHDPQVFISDTYQHRKYILEKSKSF